MKKTIIIFVVIIILAVATSYIIKTKRYQLVFSSKLPSTSESETQNWNIYRNPQYGFEIKYPTDWKFEELPPYGVNFYPSELPKLFESDKRYPTTIAFNKISNADYPLRSQMDRKKYKLDNGIEIIKFIPTTKESMLNAIIYVDNKIYQVYVEDRVFDQKDINISGRDIFDKMLSTIKPAK